MSEVIRSEPLIGGMSSVVERQWLADGSSVVTRTITDAEWLAREPGLIRQEATALELLEPSIIRAPRLVGTEGDSRLTMSFVDGEMVIDAAGLAARVEAIAAIAVDIAAVYLPEDHDLPAWRSWAAAELEPPPWGDRELWSLAIKRYRTTRPPAAPRECLLHRDLHPLNLLWPAEGPPAVVDWVNACVGHPHAELGHLRWNLTVLSGLDAADRMLEAYLERSSDVSYDRWWDLAPLMSFLPGPMAGLGWQAVGRTDLTPAVVIERTEEFLASALGAN